MESEPVDNRKHRRFSLRVPIYVAAADGVVRKTIHIESRDISAGGVSFETGRELPLEAESQVAVSRLGDVSAPVLVRGRVAWTKALPEAGRYLVGVEFTDFDGLTREELVARMEAWAKADAG
ncbi:MAG TPA: PilZ domain-containing protein [Vicinamibacteria bacterium]|jgi:c-di-GMP-binding flagellar brake protein YcgR|nr:PilZ domain-containing protein [Vicinamibacteria bacterium]